MLAHSPDILEVGYVAFFKRLMPGRTAFVAVESAAEEHSRADVVLRRRNFWQLARLIQDPRFRVIIVRVNHHPGELWRRVISLLAGDGDGPLRRLLRRRSFVEEGRSIAPLVVLDFEDEDFIHESVRPLLLRATLFYKRELPVDRWRLLRPMPLQARDEGIHRGDLQSAELLQRLRPLPLGLPLDHRRFLISADPVQKTSDLFFAGRVQASSWIRDAGLQELQALRARGVRVDVPAELLQPSNFYQRCAAAWLTWSPQGYGWECFRHYEAAACRSIPVINYPTIERHEGLIDGTHAVFYDPQPGGLTNAILRALNDRERLVSMANQAREQVLTHHTPEATAHRILASVDLDAQISK